MNHLPPDRVRASSWNSFPQFGSDLGFQPYAQPYAQPTPEFLLSQSNQPTGSGYTQRQNFHLARPVSVFSPWQNDGAVRDYPLSESPFPFSSASPTIQNHSFALIPSPRQYPRQPSQPIVDQDWEAEFLNLSPEDQAQLEELDPGIEDDEVEQIQPQLVDEQIGQQRQEEVEGLPPAGLRTRISPAEWERHKPTIKKLYLDENRSLVQTKRILKEEHNFDAP